MGPYIVIAVLVIIGVLVGRHFYLKEVRTRERAITCLGIEYRLLADTMDNIESRHQAEIDSLTAIIDFMSKSISLVHWEACKLAAFFESMGVDFNWVEMGELTDEHFSAFANERPKFFTGISHTIEVEMHPVSEMRAGVMTNGG